ncbi:hypothetical protein Ancab_036110 [Ancistrocladus abbreviatus]
MEVGNVERPIELYKATFSDHSDDELEEASNNQVEDPQKKIEAANTTLDRLIAGEFLEYLGKELGIEVPPDLPVTSNNARTRAPQTDVNANAGGANPFDDMPFCALTAVNGFLEYLGKELGIEVPPDLPVTSNNARTRAPQTDVNANAGGANPFDDMPFCALTAVNGFLRNEGVSPSKPLSLAIVNETARAGASVSETANLREHTAKVPLDKVAPEGRKAESSPLWHHHRIQK